MKDVDIIGLGWTMVAIYNEESLFSRGNYIIILNDRNGFIQICDDPLVTMVHNIVPKSSNIWEGYPKSLLELKIILVKFGVDMRWIDEIRELRLNMLGI